MQVTAARTEVRCAVLSWRRMLLFSSTPPMLILRRPKSCLCTLPGLNWKWWVRSANRLLSLCCVTTSSRSAIPQELGQLQNQCAGKSKDALIFHFHFVGICRQQGSGEALSRPLVAPSENGSSMFAWVYHFCVYKDVLHQLSQCSLIGYGLPFRPRHMCHIRLLADRVENKYLFQ